MRVRFVIALVVAASAVGCATVPAPRQAALTVEDPAAEIDEETYRAVLGTVFDELLAEVLELEGLDDAELARRDIPDSVTKEDLDARMDRALRAHRVSSEQMAYFALEHPDVVSAVERDNAASMHEVQATIHRLSVRVRANGVEQTIAAIATRDATARR